MRIFINKKSFDIVIYDDYSSILQKYSISVKDSLPEYFRVIDDSQIIEEDMYIEIEDVRDILLESINDFEDLTPDNVKKIMANFPGLRKVDVVILWLQKKYKKDEKNLELILKQYEKIIKTIDRQNFHNIREVDKFFKAQPNELEKKRRTVLKNFKEKKRIEKLLDKVSTPESGNFEVQEITLLISLSLQKGISPADIFDSMYVSKNIPFIHLRYQGSNWYKVYKHITPPEEWIEKEVEEDGIYFKILSSRRGKINSLYSEGFWGEENDIQIGFRVDSEIGEEGIKKMFFDSLKNRIEYNILYERQLAIKGKFSVREVRFNRAVFADMVNNLDLISYFLFFNDLNQSSLTKKRFGFYYEPAQDFSPKKSLTIFVTPQVSGGDFWVDVRVMKAKNFQQADSFRQVFVKILGVYQENYDSVIENYRTLLPSVIPEMLKYNQKTKEKKKRDEKSGKRLQKLKEKRPGIFRPGYASLCFQSHQPYILSKEDAKKMETNKVMEYTDPTSGEKDWYACEPREEGEESIYLYPGLRANKDKNHPEYRDEVPLVPCCFTEDQYTKPGAILHKSRMAEEEEIGDIQKEADVRDIGHILTSNKRVNRGRFGKIPYYLSIIAKKSGYEEITKGKQSFLPILRYGVVDAPDSFLHCIEKATNPVYSSLDKEERFEKIRNVRETMAEMNFAPAMQEFYDYTDEEIKNILFEEERYLDPGILIRLAEVHYDINIFIYQVDDDHPSGAVVIPRFSNAYLTREISREKPTVFIIKNKVRGQWPYQCELLVKFQPESRNQRFVYLFKDEPFVEKAIEVFNETNKISVLTPTSVIA